MTPEEHWKNFNLGTELDIAGRFLYNGIQCFHQMTTFSKEEDIFEFLYFVSVGIERLLKIAIILTEHESDCDQEALEQSLITHSHGELVRRLNEHHTLNFGGLHNEFIAILSRFYKSQRYGRYSLQSVYSPAEEREQFTSFLEKHLEIQIDTKSMLAVTRNEDRHKKFVGKVISKIALSVFEIVTREAKRLNIYTYEIAYASKASKIFHFKDFDFLKEDILSSELLVYLMSKNATGSNSQFLRSIESLSFDPALESEYLDALRSDLNKLSILDELEELYAEEVKDFKDRVGMLGAASSEYLSYGMDDEETDD